MYKHTPTPHTHATLTPHIHSQTYTTTLRFKDRVLGEITEVIKDSVGDGHVTILLWLHAREAAPVNIIWKNPPMRHCGR
jgi:hypothetical protein